MPNRPEYTDPEDDFALPDDLFTGVGEVFLAFGPTDAETLRDAGIDPDRIASEIDTDAMYRDWQDALGGPPWLE